MSLSLSYFQKELHQLTTEDIISFFSVEQEETATLEFKSGSTNHEDIHKEVCAFLNSEGGILVLGSPKETKIGPRRICIGKPEACTLIRAEHSLLQSIGANLSPTPTGIKCIALPLDGGFIYILEVIASVKPPHQVSKEGKYYIRIDKEAKAAPHYIVEALFYKRTQKELMGSFPISAVSINTDYSLDSMFLWIMIPLTLENVGTRPVSLVRVTLKVSYVTNEDPEFVLLVTYITTNPALILKSGEILNIDLLGRKQERRDGHTHSKEAELITFLNTNKSKLSVSNGVATTTGGELIDFKVDIGDV